MPKPLFMKLLIQAAIGGFCVLIGCAYGIRFHDWIFVIMSLLIGICCLFRTISLYRLVRTQSYRVLTGTCIKRDPVILRKVQQIQFTDGAGLEYHFSLDKTAKLLQGHHYRLYFRKNSYLDPNVQANGNFFHSSDFLGYEEVATVTEKTEQPDMLK